MKKLSKLLLMILIHTALGPSVIEAQDCIVQKEVADVSFNFENISLEFFLKEIEKIFQVQFIYNLKPKTANTKEPSLNETKICFRTNRLFTKSQAWAIVDAFLDIANLARVKVAEMDQVFKIIHLDNARQEALPSYIGTNPDDLPDQGLIRYVYFLKNSSTEQMKSTLEKLKSKNALLSVYQDLNALIMTDQAYNIKMLMKIVKELDSACNPVALSVLKLREVDAIEVAQLYDDLKNKGKATSPYGYPIPTKSDSQHFMQESTVFAEPRTNTLIVIGPPDANAKIEKFIAEHIDTKLNRRRSSLHSIELNYISAEQITDIFNGLAKFGEGSEVSKFGATREGEKYFNKLHFEAEKQTNSLLVRGSEEDFAMIKNIIKELDKPQPQVAIEVLIVSLQDVNSNTLTSQLHNPTLGNVNFQTSGFGGTGTGNGSGVVVSNGTLVSDLINLATSASVGSLVMSIGKGNVWALLGILGQNTKTNVISNPFLIATNKYKSQAISGQERRVATQNIVGSNNTTSGITPITAELSVGITPRINSLGVINLDIDIKIENFTSSVETNGNKDAKSIQTNASIMDGEVLAIGGLTRHSNQNTSSGMPVLSKIPVLGNLFKTRNQKVVKEHLLIFIIPKTINPLDHLNKYTQHKFSHVNSFLGNINQQNRDVQRDPIARWVFVDDRQQEKETIDDFAKYGTTLAKSKARQTISQSIAQQSGSGK